jgi:hypothetical protein
MCGRCPRSRIFWRSALAGGCKSCVRPVCAVLMTADPDVIRRSGLPIKLAPPHVGPPPPESVYRTLSLPQGGRRVLLDDLNCSEWRWLLPPRRTPQLGEPSTARLPSADAVVGGHSRRLSAVLGMSASPATPAVLPHCRETTRCANFGHGSGLTYAGPWIDDDIELSGPGSSLGARRLDAQAPYAWLADVIEKVGRS